MKKIIYTLLFLSISLSAMAQTTKFSVTGSLKGADDAPISSATVVLLQAKDSILYKFAVSNATGDFLIKKVLPGDYILQTTYIGFQTVNQPIKVEKDENAEELEAEANENSEFLTDDNQNETLDNDTNTENNES